MQNRFKLRLYALRTLRISDRIIQIRIIASARRCSAPVSSDHIYREPLDSVGERLAYEIQLEKKYIKKI